MSFADDFGHNIPPDDWGGSYGYKSKKYYNSSTNYRNSSSFSALSSMYKQIIRRSFISIECETAKAYLVEFEEGMSWIPKSQIDSIDKDNLILKLPYWLSRNLIFKKKII